MGMSIGLRFFNKDGAVENLILGVVLFVCVVALISLMSVTDSSFRRRQSIEPANPDNEPDDAPKRIKHHIIP